MEIMRERKDSVCFVFVCFAVGCAIIHILIRAMFWSYINDVWVVFGIILAIILLGVFLNGFALVRELWTSEGVPQWWNWCWRLGLIGFSGIMIWRCFEFVFG